MLVGMPIVFLLLFVYVFGGQLGAGLGGGPGGGLGGQHERPGHAYLDLRHARHA